MICRMRTFKAAGVKCAICGDSSHPTRDCPMKTQEPSNQAALDREYLSFMAELGDDTAKQHLETASTLATGAGPNVSYAAPIGMASAGSALATGPQQVSYAAPLPMPVPTLQYPWQQQQQQPVAPQPSPSMQQWPQPTSAYYAPAYPTVLPAFPQAQYAYPPMAPQPVGYVQPLPPPTYAPPPPPQS
jgi:splicing factor 1